MSGILKISDAASLALHVMAILAEHPDELVPARKAAEMLYVSEAHLSKVLQRLGKENLVTSTRGPGGGFRLARPSGKISLLQVYEAIDGKLDDHECLLHSRACNRNECILGTMIDSVHNQVKEYLGKTTFKDISDKEHMAACLKKGKL